jgi:Uri superfamily endonuclease
MTAQSNALTSQPGTYALVLDCRSIGTVRIGRLGPAQFRPGFCVYVGSAFGPGGLAARIRHHQQISPRPHWHIDYLRAECDLVEVWFAADGCRQEHTWARTMGRLRGVSVPLARFGSSDCECPTHLFWFRTQPSFPRFSQRLTRCRIQRLRIRNTNPSGMVTTYTTQLVGRLTPHQGTGA